MPTFLALSCIVTFPSIDREIPSCFTSDLLSTIMYPITDSCIKDTVSYTDKKGLSN